MSVLKNKRGLSKMEFYHNARKLRRELKDLLRREFGVHSRGNASKIDPALPDDWYDEDIRETAQNIRLLLRNLVWNITAANTIHAKNMHEFEDRRRFQNAAIINCQQLLQEFQDCEDSLPINAEKLLPYVEAVGFEITLLKGWRKSDNRLQKVFESAAIVGVMEFIDFESAKTAVDLGCGNGKLGTVLQANGLSVIGIDISDTAVENARKEHPDMQFMQADAADFSLDKPVDVVFSKSLLHWIGEDRQDRLLSCVARALKKGGQFVAEFGGEGCNALIHDKLACIFAAYGYEYKMPFYFPSVGEYVALVEKHGMKVVRAEVHKELAKLQGRDGLMRWIASVNRMSLSEIKDDALRKQIIMEAVDGLRDELCKNGRWYADYVYIRMKAVKL